MRAEFFLEKDEMGTPIEIANCLIKTKLDGVIDFDQIELKRKELAEIAEHIQIYLKYW